VFCPVFIPQEFTMPNWCENEVRISGSKEDIEKIAELFDCNNNNFSFQRFMPCPEELRKIHNGHTRDKDGKSYTHWLCESVNDDENPTYTYLTDADVQALVDKYGSSNWYDWSIRNWGTKWEAHLCGNVNVFHDEAHDWSSIECNFDTAWGPPEGIYNALVSQFPDVDVDWFYKEPGMRFAGWLGSD
jgi:hypothetical protein